jgi:hypothetical protein
LNLITGEVLNEALRDPNNRISKIVAANKDDATIVRELYLAILCRQPNDKELQLGLESLRGNDEEHAKLMAERQRREAALAAHEQQLPALAAAWEQTIGRTPVWEVLQPGEMKAAAGAKLDKQADGSILVTGPNVTPETYTITFETKLKGITGIRLEALADSKLPKKGPGRAENGNFVLNEFKIEATKPDKSAAQKIKLQRPQADFSQDGYPINNAVDGNPDSGWAIAPQLGKSHTAVFEAQSPFGFPEGTVITVTMLQKTVKDHNLGKFRISATTTRAPVLLQGQVPAQISKLLDVPADKRTPEQKTAIMNHYRSIDQELARLQRRVNEFAVPADARALGAQDLAWALINSPAFLFNH